jgi:NADPH:quinone reductase
MKAIKVRAFGAPEVLQLTDALDPVPALDQILVEVHAAGVNPVETYIRSGNYGRLPELPFTPGSDAAGVVKKIGGAVQTSLKVGDRVWLSGCTGGAYAEQTLCSAEQAHRLPDHVTFAQGAALGIAYATAYRALFQRGDARPGKTVLVHGATGGVGIATVQFARTAGLRVFATGGTERGRGVLLDNGAHEALDHTQSDYLDRLAEKTGGRGPDLIVEMLANENLGNDLNVIARGGCIVIVGARGPAEINPRFAMQRECDIRGLMLFNATPAELAEANAAVAIGLENRTLNPVVAVEIPLAEAARAHVAVMAPGHRGKVVLVRR